MDPIQVVYFTQLLVLVHIQNLDFASMRHIQSPAIRLDGQVIPNAFTANHSLFNQLHFSTLTKGSLCNQCQEANNEGFFH